MLEWMVSIKDQELDTVHCRLRGKGSRKRSHYKRYLFGTACQLGEKATQSSKYCSDNDLAASTRLTSSPT